MTVSRPVIAFALLRQASDLLQNDLLSGVSLLIRPIVADLSGQLYDAQQLADRMAKSYGISLPGAALEAFTGRLISADILRREDSPSGMPRAVYCEQPETEVSLADDEGDYQKIIDGFLSNSKILIDRAGIRFDPDELTSGFLRHICTLDFTAIKARPIMKREAGDTIIGPAKKEQIALSNQLAQSATMDALVAAYIAGLQEKNPDQLEKLAQVADGALGVELVLDLQAPTSVPRLVSTTVMVDTPILLSFLDLSSALDTIDTKKLFSQIQAAGPKIAAFQHSIEEAEGVLSAIQLARSAGEAYGPSVARLSNSRYRAYFESMRGRIATTWLANQLEIVQETAGQYYKNFSQTEEDELIRRIQLNPLDRRLTRERDAKSIAEIMRRLAGGHIPITSISSCRFIFVTTNTALQGRAAAFLRERKFVREGEFMPIATSRYLAGLCWLIAGGKSDQSPTVARLLANCATALRLRPELADRTKRFLLNIDPDKARHFEALMTNDRASQYLMEVTLGNPDLITAMNVEDIFEEVQRRAAEKVAKEKDDFYQEQLLELTERISSSSSEESRLREQLAVIDIEAQSRRLEAASLAAEAGALREERDEQLMKSAQQGEDISRLNITIEQVQNSAKIVSDQLRRQRDSGILGAKIYANGRVRAIQLLFAIFLFGVVVALNYFDKFLIPSLTPENQRRGNIIIVLAQGLFVVLGLSVLFDRVVEKPLSRWRQKLYRQRLSELGISPDDL